MSASLSPEVSGLLNQLAHLSNELKDGQVGAREGLMGACSALISQLAYPMESILMLYWAQVGISEGVAQSASLMRGSANPPHRHPLGS